MSFLLAEGQVHHTRPGAHANKFRYPIFYLQFPVAEEAGLRELLAQKFHGWLKVRSTDYLRGESQGLADSVRKLLREDCGFEAEDISLQTMPRMFGYGFNPVSFWWCRREGRLEGVLCEVNNTFGERHLYWIQPGGEISPEAWIEAKKIFHVSPFFPVSGTYKFRFANDGKIFRVNINYFDDAGELKLATSVDGTLSPLSQHGMAGLLLRYGWMTPLVVLRIHYQALKLFLKGARFHPKPVPPSQEISS